MILIENYVMHNPPATTALASFSDKVKRPLSDLPLHIRERTCWYMDVRTLIHFSRTNKTHQELAAPIIKQRLQLIKDLYANAPELVKNHITENQAIALWYTRFQPDPIFNFMRKWYSLAAKRARLTPAQLSATGFACFWILSRLKQPNLPLLQVTVFTEDNIKSQLVRWREQVSDNRGIASTIYFWSGIMALFTAADLLMIFTKEGDTNNFMLHSIAVASIGFIYVHLCDKKDEIIPVFSARWLGIIVYPNQEREPVLMAEYRRWLSQILSDLRGDTKEFINDPEIVGIAPLGQKIGAHALKVFQGARLFSLSYLACFPLSPVCLPLELMRRMIDEPSNETEENTPVEAGISGRELSKILLISAVYSVVFYASYTSDMMDDIVDDYVHNSKDHIKVCFASMAAGAVGFATILAPKATKRAAAYVYPEMLRTADLLSKSVDYVAGACSTARRFCLSWAGLARQNDLERNSEAALIVINNIAHISSNNRAR